MFTQTLKDRSQKSIRRALDAIGLLGSEVPERYDWTPPMPGTVPLSILPHQEPTPDPLSAASLDAGMQEALSPQGIEGGLDALIGLPLTRDNVEAVLDDMVRPALNADGGDISLVKIENNNVYVRLIGACSTCPSSVMTMRMGVERLLQDEFPDLEELIQVDSMMQ